MKTPEALKKFGKDLDSGLYDEDHVLHNMIRWAKKRQKFLDTRGLVGARIGSLCEVVKGPDMGMRVTLVKMNQTRGVFEVIPQTNGAYPAGTELDMPLAVLELVA